MRKRSICQVVNNLDVGGLEKVVIALTRNLDRSRFVPYLICLDGRGKLFDEAGVPPERCLVLHKSPAMNLGLLRVDPRALWQIRAFVRERALDLIHAHNVAPLAYAGVATRLGRRPVMVYSEHNQIYSASAASKLKFRYYLHLADHLVAVSHDLSGTLVREARVRRRIRVLHNGIDGARFRRLDGAPVRAELGLAAGERLVGTGVVLSEQKGIRYLLEAAGQVVSSRPEVRFAIAGDGPLRGELEQRASALGLDDKVAFLGYRADMPEVISALDVYVLPSLWEGLPLALLEAMAIGKPIVATRVGGNPEVVEHGVNGFLVPPRDPGALAEHILRALDDEDFRRRAEQANARRFAREFSLEAMVRAHEQLYEEVTG